MAKLKLAKMFIEFSGHLHTAGIDPPFITQLGSAKVGNKRLSSFLEHISILKFEDGF